MDDTTWNILIFSIALLTLIIVIGVSVRIGQVINPALWKDSIYTMMKKPSPGSPNGGSPKRKGSPRKTEMPEIDGSPKRKGSPRKTEMPEIDGSPKRKGSPRKTEMPEIDGSPTKAT